MTKQAYSFNTVKKVHFITGITISLFISTHLLNQATILLGEDWYQIFMSAARIVYRNILVESILLLGVLLQVFSGIKLLRKKWKRQLSVYDKLFIYSGLYLSFFLLAHVAAVLSTRYFFELDTNLYFGTAVLNTFPHVLFFAPYYGMAIIAFFTHLACIYRIKKLSNKAPNLSKINRQANFIIGFSLLLTVLILSRMIYCIEIPLEYQY
ncbi:MAG: hypothetical protein GY810_09370 [Aureispira sp.]|nr:hypothetical protein [Aureispira sp.]